MVAQELILMLSLSQSSPTKPLKISLTANLWKKPPTSWNKYLPSLPTITESQNSQSPSTKNYLKTQSKRRSLDSFIAMVQTLVLKIFSLRGTKNQKSKSPYKGGSHHRCNFNGEEEDKTSYEERFKDFLGQMGAKLDV